MRLGFTAIAPLFLQIVCAAVPRQIGLDDKGNPSSVWIPLVTEIFPSETISLFPLQTDSAGNVEYEVQDYLPTTTLVMFLSEGPSGALLNHVNFFQQNITLKDIIEERFYSRFVTCAPPSNGVASCYAYNVGLLETGKSTPFLQTTTAIAFLPTGTGEFSRSTQPTAVPTATTGATNTRPTTGATNVPGAAGRISVGRAVAILPCLLMSILLCI